MKPVSDNYERYMRTVFKLETHSFPVLPRNEYVETLIGLGIKQPPMVQEQICNVYSSRLQIVQHLSRPDFLGSQLIAALHRYLDSFDVKTIEDVYKVTDRYRLILTRLNALHLYLYADVL